VTGKPDSVQKYVEALAEALAKDGLL
jgi:hypothetical protein